MKLFYDTAAAAKENNLATVVASMCEKTLKLEDRPLALLFFCSTPQQSAQTKQRSPRRLCGPYASSTKGVACSAVVAVFDATTRMGSENFGLSVFPREEGLKEDPS